MKVNQLGVTNNYWSSCNKEMDEKILFESHQIKVISKEILQ